MNIILKGRISKSGYGKATEAFKECFERIKNHNIDYNFHGENVLKKYDVEFIIGPPPYSPVKSADYRIIYFYWEATSLPSQWVPSIMMADEIWAPCDLVADACYNAGYNGKISIVPTPSISNGIGNNLKLWSKNKNIFLDNSYKFYSIFQWQPRKGYQKLLQAYFDEFKADDATLVIKTDLIKNTNESSIIKEISYYKERYKSNSKVFLITDYLTDNQIFNIHHYCNCFVLPHSGEGWGMPIHEAATFGNPIITTKFGGISDFIDDNCFWINHNLEPVTGMSWNPVYNKNQNWAAPNVDHLMELMRYVYNNKVQKTNKFLDFNIENVSKIISGKLNEI